MRLPGASQKGAREGPFLLSAALAALAIAVPGWLPLSNPPLVSLDTDALTLLLFGVWLTWLAPRVKAPALSALWRGNPGMRAVLTLFGISIAAVAASIGFEGLPVTIGLRYVAALAGGAVAVVAGARMAATIATGPESGNETGTNLASAVMVGFVLAGLGNAAIAVAQYFGVSGFWGQLAPGAAPGGELGQPNLLGSQLLWALLALVTLSEVARVPQVAHRLLARLLERLFVPLFVTAGLLLALALAMTASRTALLGSLLGTLWALFDRRLSRRSRLALLFLPALLLLLWWVLGAVAPMLGHAFEGTVKLHAADPSSSRFNLWRQSAVLIRQNPWFGVGWGQFNFAWTLTPMAPMPRHAWVLTNAHNLLIQWAVELGVPAALLMTGLLAFALLWTGRRLLRPGSEGAVTQRAAFVMLMAILLHSQLEYPLWNANFLLPAALLFGLAVGGRPAPGGEGGAGEPATRPGSTTAPLLLALAGAFAIYDYRIVADIYAPPPDAAPLEQRIAKAQGSMLFGHLADRFAGTLAPAGQRRLEPYRQTVFEMLDWRLLASWAQAYAERGQLDKARYLAARLREFDGPGPQAFFRACGTDPKPFQCLPAQTPLSFRDFRR